MSLWRQFSRGLRVLTCGDAAEQDLNDEVEHYYAEAVAAAMARGLSPGEARRAVRLAYGHDSLVRERVRSSRWEQWWAGCLGDLKVAARRLRSTPGFTAIILLILALGVGATTAIFGTLHGVLFAPLPYPEGERLALVTELRGDGGRNGNTFGMYRELADRARSFADIAAFKAWQPTWTGGGEPERLEGARVSSSYFAVLHRSPALGRAFQGNEDRLRGPNVAIVSDALWRRRFGGDPGVLGRFVVLDSAAFVIVGVMSPGFLDVLTPGAEIWSPLQYDLSEDRAWGHHLRLVARVAPGSTLANAQREVNDLGQAVARRHPDAYGPKLQLAVLSLHDDLTRTARPALLAIFAAAGVLLIIACVNVTSLLLARGARRRQEFALRSALGAGRLRLSRQLLTESLLLAACGGALSMGVAAIGVRALLALGPPGLPPVHAVGVDGTVLLFGWALTTLVGLACGLGPTLQQMDPSWDLQHGSPRVAGGRRRARSALVVVEVALAFVLLVTSGLLLRSLVRLFSVEVGISSRSLLTMQVQAAGQRLVDPRSGERFFTAALAAVRRLPGVTAAAMTSQLPLSGDRDEYGAHTEAVHGRQAVSGSAFRYAVSPGYFEAMGIALRQGRVLDERDREGAPLVAVVSESFARQRFGAASPIGERLRVGPANGPPFTIVGVVGDVRQLSLALSDADAVYTTSSQWLFPDDARSLVVRTSGPPLALAPLVRQAVWSVDKDQPILRLATMESLLGASAGERRFALVLFAAFAFAALVLAAAGIYGVLAGSVAERTAEIGVRSALGASRASLLGMVLREGMLLTGLGLALGLGGALVASLAVTALLFGVSRFDPLTYLAMVALLAAVAALACGLPARRAVGIDPSQALRAQ